MEYVKLTACEALIKMCGTPVCPFFYFPISSLVIILCPCYPLFCLTGCFPWLCSPVACYLWLLDAFIASFSCAVWEALPWILLVRSSVSPRASFLMLTQSLSVLILGYGYACFNPASNMLSIKVLLLPPACYTHLIISILWTAVLYFGKMKPCVEVFLLFLLCVNTGRLCSRYYCS